MIVEFDKVCECWVIVVVVVVIVAVVVFVFFGGWGVGERSWCLVSTYRLSGETQTSCTCLVNVLMAVAL